MISKYKFLDSINFNFSDNKPFKDQVAEMTSDNANAAMVASLVPLHDKQTDMVCPLFLEKLMTLNVFAEAAKVSLLSSHPEDDAESVLAGVHSLRRLVSDSVNLMTRDFSSDVKSWSEYNNEIKMQGFSVVIEDRLMNGAFVAYWNSSMSALWLVTSSSSHGIEKVSSSDLHLCGRWIKGKEGTELRASKHHVLMSDIMNVLIDMRFNPLARLTAVRESVEPVAYWPESSVGCVAFENRKGQLPKDVYERMFSQNYDNDKFSVEVRSVMDSLHPKQKTRAKLYHDIRTHHPEAASTTSELRNALEANFAPECVSNAVICANWELYSVPRVGKIVERLGLCVNFLRKEELAPYHDHIESNLESYGELMSNDELDAFMNSYRKM